MRNRLIALVLLAVAIAVLVWLFAGRDEPAQPVAVPLTTLAPATVTRLVVKKLDQPLFVLVKSSNGWVMLEPRNAHANTTRVNLILANLGEATARSYPANSLKLAEAGLAPPAWTLIVNGLRLDFGTLNPTSFLRYVRRGDTVYLVMDRIAPLLAGGTSAFIAPPSTKAAHAGTAGG